MLLNYDAKAVAEIIGIEFRRPTEGKVKARSNRKSPPSSSRFVEAVVPDEVSREDFDPASHPGWDNPHDMAVAQAFGRDWIKARRTALLIVPSVVTGGSDLNTVVNPDHPDSARISMGPERAVALDKRLFA